MVPPLRTALLGASLSRPMTPTNLTPLRRYSSQTPSPTGAFYKTFTRPVAKCALLAVFVYQLVYFGWTKLEVEEIKEERQAEIARLEARVRSLHAAQQAAAAAAAAQSESSSKVAGGSRGKDGAEGSKGSWWLWK
ncbi:hypothetical protein VTH82DRAFT_5210 [Thermothelomyces myriococcoides]